MLLSGLLGLVAVIWFVLQPAENRSHRDWSKIARVLTILYLAPPLSAHPIPIGAIVAIWHNRHRPTGAPAPG